MDLLIARQPIFDTESEVQAYQLCYHGGELVEPGEPSSNGTQKESALRLISSIQDIGLEHITGGRPAYLAFPPALVLDESVTMLPSDEVIIAIDGDVGDDPGVVDACTRYREAGYSLAFEAAAVADDPSGPLTALADYLSVDLEAVDFPEADDLVRRVDRLRPTLMAQGVHTRELQLDAQTMGFELFQGDFFCEAEAVTGHTVPAYKLNLLRVLEEMQSLELDYGKLEKAVKAVPSLAVKLLRYLNSAAFGWRREITSIRQALVAVGEVEFRKWVSLMCLSGLAEDKPRELLLRATHRGHFCEGMAPLLNMESVATDLFLTGLLSLVDTMVDRPLDEILGELALAAGIKTALLSGDGPLAEVLECALAYETGDWKWLLDVIRRLAVKGNDVTELYLGTIRTAEHVFAA